MLRHRGVTVVAWNGPTGEPVQRTIYALTPPGRLHPLTGSFLDAIRVG